MERRYKIFSLLLIITLVGTVVWGNIEHNMRKDYEYALNNEYQRMFFEMKDHVETVQVSLSKVLLSMSKEQNILLLSQIWQQALNAEEKLSQLPLRHDNLTKTEKFLNQVGDFCYALIIGELSDTPLNEEQSNSLKELQTYTTTLTEELNLAESKLKEGKATIRKLKYGSGDKIEEINDDMIDINMINFEESMSEYPELIYDGPFSEQTINEPPKGLTGEEITPEKAEEILKQVAGDDNLSEITMFESGEDADSVLIPAYTFSAKSGDVEIYAGISKIGGHIVWMEKPRDVTSVSLEEEEAQQIAQEYLKNLGYENMEPNYSVRYNNSILFNFAYTENDVTIYTDLIKVKVALDDGEVVGIDAAAYVKSHHEREIDVLTPTMNLEEARGNVKVDFNIENERLTIIPKYGKIEVLCYEFSGKYDDSDFLVYINAKTGKQEEILKIIKDENGTLMI